MHVILCPTVQQLGLLVSDLKRRLQKSDKPPANLTGPGIADPQCSIAAVAHPPRMNGMKGIGVQKH